MSGVDNFWLDFDPNYFDNIFTEELYPPSLTEVPEQRSHQGPVYKEESRGKRTREPLPEDSVVPKVASKKPKMSKAAEGLAADKDPLTIFKTTFKPSAKSAISPIPVVSQNIAATVKVIFDVPIDLDDAVITAKFSRKKARNGSLDTKEISEDDNFLVCEDPPYVEIIKGKTTITYSFKVSEGFTSFRKHAVYHLSFLINDKAINVLDHIIVVSKSTQVNEAINGKPLSSRIISLVSHSTWYADFKKQQKEKPRIVVKKEIPDEVDYIAIIDRLIRQKRQEIRKLQNLKNTDDPEAVMEILLNKWSKE